MNRAYAKKAAKALVAQMTLEEKASQLLYNSPAIERLGIKEYNWWNEASHGVARAGTATVFPHAVAMAATFDPAMIKTVGEAVAEEARAKYNENRKEGDRDIYKGLTFWTPNLNIFRDPRWGRGQETFGEDPYLTAVMGCEYINGLQGEGEFLKSAACAKHLAAHSGPEALRHSFDAKVSPKDLWETYLPAFEWVIKHTEVAGVMGAYNRLNGVPCCCSEELLRNILVEQWGFDGYVVSDCGALRDVSQGHRYTDSDEESAALALKNGCHLNCGWAYERLIDAYEMDLITEEEITAAAEKLFMVRFLLGEFEKKVPWAEISYDRVNCKEHRELNLRVARECMVLLKNQNGFLPMKPGRISRIAVVGPNSMNITALEGNYNGYASRYITVADGIREIYAESEILVAKGCHMWYEGQNEWNGFGNIRSDGIAAASHADVTILCLGLDSSIEGEEGCVSGEYTQAGDKRDLYLPETQRRLAEDICDICENVVVILMSGGALDLGEKVTAHAKAVIQAWYPGALGGLAVAQLLAGIYSPSGKLPITFYCGNGGLPAFEDYNMKGRTYRYCREKVLYPFGFGLSYTEFSFDNLTITRIHGGWQVTAEVKNTGKRSGQEKVQIYAAFQDTRTDTPVLQLCGLCPIGLAPGEKKRVAVKIDEYWVAAVLSDGKRVRPDGKILIYVGGSQPDARSRELTGMECLCGELRF
ncbi:MAG: glycoside hydrolase family 3 C-terminal domain-containing protein [Roseburia sp.]|nr:glycoside hydrolase family 3 C-terminal domain-containing protein [Roseburia sp.]MCM1096674.1 glycoside hydrolase family 3 C-terminal domain-containing protein [Ruminococcus flavefaciens]